MCGINLNLSNLEKDSRQQISDIENTINKLCVEHPEIEPQITTYMEQVEKGFKEVIFKEPVTMPEVFLKEYGERL